MRWPGLKAGCRTARLATVPMHPSLRLSSWGSWRLHPTFLLPSPYPSGVGLHKSSRPATFFPVSPLFDPGRRPTGCRVGMPFVPTPFGVSRRAGAVKDGRKPPRSGARKACVLDGSEHRGTSPAVNGGSRACQPLSRRRSARLAFHSALSRAHRVAWMAFNRSNSASVKAGKPLRIS